eukprot:340742-Pleurochrysis_carterae.AAC.1
MKSSGSRVRSRRQVERPEWLRALPSSMAAPPRRGENRARLGSCRSAVWRRREKPADGTTCQLTRQE